MDASQPGQDTRYWRNPPDRGASIASASLTGIKCMADASHEGDTANTDNPWGRDRTGNRNNKAVAGRQHSKSQKIGNDE